MQIKPINQPLRVSRSIHMIRAGESLASLALKHYGDARFAKLITTINRGEIQTRSDGFSSFAFVCPGMMVVLPTYEEANIFSSHFFTKQSQNKFDLAFFARPAMPSDSISGDILPSQGSKNGKEESKNQSQNSAVSSSQNAARVPFLQNAGPAAKESAAVMEAVAPVPAAIEYLLPAFPQLSFCEDRIDMQPPTVNVARLEDGKSIPTAPEVVSFSHYCRMIKFEADGGQSDTVIKLQVLEDTRWQTITAYIISEQTSRRLAHYAEKENRTVDIDLPSAVARELSMSDLKRNWKHYVQSYLSSKNRFGVFGSSDNVMVPAC